MISRGPRLARVAPSVRHARQPAGAAPRDGAAAHHRRARRRAARSHSGDQHVRGQGRDLLGALETHVVCYDVTGRLVELDPELARVARAACRRGSRCCAPTRGRVPRMREPHPPTSFGVRRVRQHCRRGHRGGRSRCCPRCARPRAIVIWTRNRKAPDATPKTRARFSRRGSRRGGVRRARGGSVRRRYPPARGPSPAFDPAPRLFDFADDSVPVDCPQCGFRYYIGRMGVNAWLKSDAEAFVQRCAAIAPVALRTRPAPDVWSPLEYACHVRDVLRVQRERIELAQRADEPVFTPYASRRARPSRTATTSRIRMKSAPRSSRPPTRCVATLASLDDAGWARTGIYNYPEPSSRTVEWIAVHTVHELPHHRIDIGTLA